MIALDTNILVHAHRRDSPFHAAARQAVKDLAEGPAAWGIPWTCLHEFHGIVTHPRIYTPPSTPAQSVSQIDSWLESPTVQLLSENDLHWKELRDMLVKARVQGPLVHDARIAAICLSHGVHELWSADRDFSRFPKLRLRNPLVGG